MSKWLSKIENSATTQALKTKAGELEMSLDRKVLTEKLQGLMKEEVEAHRVSKYKWKRAMFKFRGTLHHGIPGSPTAIAYDPLQHLMAIGTSKGLVKVFGKPGVEVVINQYEGSISHLCFANNQGKLVIVHKGGSCEGVNLDTKRPIGSYVFKGAEVTCLLHVPNTDFILVGLSTGNVHVLSTSGKLGLSSYRISGRSSLHVEKTSSISDMALHPTQANVLLLAHDCGNINEWDISTEKGIYSYKPPDTNFGTLTAVAWHPDGTFFIAGYRNGDVLLWKRGQGTSVSSITMSDHPNTPRRPIRRLFYTTLHGAPFICSFGGTSMSHEPDTASILYNQKLTLLPPKVDNEVLNLAKQKKGVAIDIAIGLPTAYPFSVNPNTIILITSTSDITVFSPAKGRFRHILAAPNLKLQTSRVTCTLFCNVSKAFLNDLLHYGGVSWEPSCWPILGGSSSIQPHTSTDVLVTGHSDGMIYFWDMSNTLFSLLYAINIRMDVTVENSAVLSIDLCPKSRILALSCASGETLVYNFSKTSTPLTQTQRELTKNELEQAEARNFRFIYNTSVPTLPEVSVKGSPTVPKISPRAVSPKPVRREKREKSTRRPATNTTAASAGPATFSWKKFFINAGIDNAGAAKYAAFFEGEKITDDLVKDLDQSLMEMAGITAVGDKMRIMKYVKGSYNRNLCMEQSSGSSQVTEDKPAKAKRKKTKKRKTTVEQKEKIVEKKSSPDRTVHEEKNTPQPRSPVEIEDEEKPREIQVPTEKPAGYQLKVDCSFRNRITTIRIASSLSKIAVGDHHGNVALLDIATGGVLLHKPLADSQHSPVTWLCFDDRAVVEKPVHQKKGKRLLKEQKKQTAVEPGLFVGLEDGRIFYIALRTGQVDSITFPGIEEVSGMQLSSILLLDGTGAAVIPSGAEWETLSDNTTSKQQFEEEEEMEVELVIKNLDEECNRAVEPTQAPSLEDSGEISLQDSKYLLVCAGTMIIIYTLPSYRVYSTFECDERPEAANVVERDGGNYCLIVFLASGDLKILTLMDLLEIKTFPGALQTIGVQFDPRKLKHDVNCTPDGRFVVLSKYQEVIRGSLFADENLLGLPYSLPRLHVPGAPEPEDEQQRGEQLFPQMDYQRLFGNVKVQTAPTPQAAPVKKEVVRGPQTRASGPMDRGDPDDQRRQLMGDAKQIKRVTPESNKKFSVGEKVARTVGSSVADVKDIMIQNMDALAQRREKLDELLVSTDAVANRASTFASVAEQMADKERNKKWWQ